MIERDKIKIEKVAYEFMNRGYHFKATYLMEPKGDALVEISKSGQIVREFIFPSYKIYNIAAHSDDIINGLEEESDKGLFIAGSTGLGGNIYNKNA